MTCVENVNYAILINGIPTSFFSAARGLCQGCSLSPLLFILVMDTLRLHIKRDVSMGNCCPLSINRGINLSHNLFVDDVVIFAWLYRQTWHYLHAILISFGRATGLCINEGKSSFRYGDVNMEDVVYLSQLFNIQEKSIKEGMKYLGYHLKPSGYSITDWSWILNRYYKRIACWEFKCLSLAGKMILTQTVLVQLIVYWAHLFFILSSIIKKINSLMTIFIWGVVRKKQIPPYQVNKYYPT